MNAVPQPGWLYVPVLVALVYGLLLLLAEVTHLVALATLNRRS